MWVLLARREFRAKVAAASSHYQCINKFSTQHDIHYVSLYWLYCIALLLYTLHDITDVYRYSLTYRLCMRTITHSCLGSELQGQGGQPRTVLELAHRSCWFIATLWRKLIGQKGSAEGWYCTCNVFTRFWVEIQWTFWSSSYFKLWNSFVKLFFSLFSIFRTAVRISGPRRLLRYQGCPGSEFKNPAKCIRKFIAHLQISEQYYERRNDVTTP